MEWGADSQPVRSAEKVKRSVVSENRGWVRSNKNGDRGGKKGQIITAEMGRHKKGAGMERVDDLHKGGGSCA